MEWSIKKKVNKKVINRAADDDKFLQVKIDRSLANDFKMMCVSMDISQKQVIEEWIQDRVHKFNRGVR